MFVKSPVAEAEGARAVGHGNALGTCDASVACTVGIEDVDVMLGSTLKQGHAVSASCVTDSVSRGRAHGVRSKIFIKVQCLGLCVDSYLQSAGRCSSHGCMTRNNYTVGDFRL